jgi:hypothetical protein
MTTIAELDPGHVITIVAISVSGGIVVMSIIFGNVRRMADRDTIEKSRREVAAYIAEGAMTPDEGERLLRADPDRRTHGGARRQS